MKHILLVFFLSISPYLLKAQYYVLGDDPSGIHWKEINTENFQVIYPASFEIKAMRMAYYLNKTYSFASKSLHHRPGKISVLLHTSTVRSNGFVAWAPARMELFTTPHQEIYAQDWLEQLAIHEFRHVVQIDKIDSELPQIFRIILGEQAAAIITGIYLPFWFLEGDAVTTETALSHSGRGRVPSFEMELKAQCLEKGIYDYDKAYLGSFKDYIPDYYQLGYQLVAGVRSRYGTESWAKVLSFVARNPLSINAFSKGLKSVTGMSHPVLYDTIFSALRTNWKIKDSSLKTTDYVSITKEQRGYNSYRYPFQINDSTIFCVKYSMDDVTRFIKIGPKGEEKRLFTPGNLFEESITYAHDMVVWIEPKLDLRWTHREFSYLRILNLKTGKVLEKRFQEKIYAPCLSEDGLHLIAVKIDNDNRSSFVFLSVKNLAIDKEVKVSNDLFIMTPSWGENGNELFAVVLGNKGKTLAKIDALTGEITNLLPFTYNEYGRPVQQGNLLFYTSSIDGSDNVYTLNLKDNVNSVISTSRFGVKDVHPDSKGTGLIYSNYTANGYKIVKTPLRPLLIKALADTLKTHTYELADQLTAQENTVVEFSAKDTTLYHPENYSKIEHLFNFHSWAPAHIDLSSETIRPGVSLMSQNKLSTAITQLGYDYSTINKTGKWVAEFDYTGLFPVIKLKSDYGRERSSYYQIDAYINNLSHAVRRDTQQINFSYNILNINGIINIPLNLSHGKWNRLLQPEFQIGNRKIWQDQTTPINNSSKTWLTYRLYFHNLLQTGLRDIQPAIGQITDLNYHYSPSKDSNPSPIWSAEETIYLPGIVRHHGLRFYGGFQHKLTSASSLSDYISYPRGYTNLLNNQLFCIKSDYVFPLFYPDWSLGRLSYFKRVSLRLFYDQAWATVPLTNQRGEYKYQFSSAGGELISDCNFLRLYVPAKIGLRISNLIEQKKIIFEFLLAINFSAL